MSQNHAIRCRRPLAALGLTAAILLTGCGIGDDSRPRDIPPDQRAPLLGGAQPAAEASTRSTRVYFFGSESNSPDRLEAANRSVAPSPELVMRELLAGLSDSDVTRNLRTAIPVGTTLRTALLSGDGTAVVDLSQEFFEARGEQQVRAVAQIVYSLTALDGVTAVRLLVDGAAREWPRSDGTIRNAALTTADFAGFSPTSAPDYLPTPSPTVAPTVAPATTLITAIETVPSTTTAASTTPPSTVG
jgi:hypothetical protein